jgi:hypothetical protein
MINSLDCDAGLMSTRRQQELITSDCKAIVLRNKSNLIGCDASMNLRLQP